MPNDSSFALPTPSPSSAPPPAYRLTISSVLLQLVYFFLQLFDYHKSFPFVLQVASLDGHRALVTAVIVVPASTQASKILCYCWTASLDGTIRYWDFSVPELIKIINVNSPIISMVITSNFMIILLIK